MGTLPFRTLHLCRYSVKSANGIVVYVWRPSGRSRHTYGLIDVEQTGFIEWNSIEILFDNKIYICFEFVPLTAITFISIIQLSIKTHFVFEVHVVQMTDVFSPIFFVCNRMFSLVNLQICTATHSLQCTLMEHEIAAIECRQNTHHDLPYFFMHIEDEKHHHIKLMMLFLFESTLLCKRGMDAQQHTAHCTHTLDQRSVSSSKAWRKMSVAHVFQSISLDQPLQNCIATDNKKKQLPRNATRKASNYECNSEKN